MIDELTLYEEILELTSPWFVEGIELDKANNAVEVYVVAEELLALCCPLRRFSGQLSPKVKCYAALSFLFSGLR